MSVGSLPSWTTLTSSPVSYTHLDVYKRQHRRCGPVPSRRRERLRRQSAKLNIAEQKPSPLGLRPQARVGAQPQAALGAQTEGGRRPDEGRHCHENPLTGYGRVAPFCCLALALQICYYNSNCRGGFHIRLRRSPHHSPCLLYTSRCV